MRTFDGSFSDFGDTFGKTFGGLCQTFGGTLDGTLANIFDIHDLENAATPTVPVER